MCVCGCRGCRVCLCREWCFGVQVGQTGKSKMSWTNPLPKKLKCAFQYSVGESGRGFPAVTLDVEP